MTKLSDRVSGLQPAATLEINEIARRLEASGRAVFNLSVGESDYPAPERVGSTLAGIAQSGLSRYTEVQGSLGLRRAVARLLNRMAYAQTSGESYAPGWGPTDVVIGVGAKQLEYAAVLSLCNPGDEVIILSPYWTSYPDIVRMCGTVPVIVPSDANDGFIAPVERIAAAITPRTRMLILNTPNNPTGQMWNHEQIDALCGLVLSTENMFLLSDEIYSQIVFNGNRHVSPVTHSPQMHARTILVSGLSKAYAMSGWRLGYAAVADDDLRRAMIRVNGNTVSSPPSMTQEAAIAALEETARVDEMRLDFAERASLLERRLNAMGLPTLVPQGSFYIYADVGPLIGGAVAGRPLATPRDIARVFLEDARVAVVPGEAFGDSQHVRFSFVRPLDDLHAACDALEAFMLRHRRRSAGSRVSQPALT